MHLNIIIKVTPREDTSGYGRGERVVIINVTHREMDVV